MTKKFKVIPEVIIDNKKIGPSHPPHIVAEMSGNHNNDINRAIQILDKAKSSGADAVKLQTYTADTITLDSAQRRIYCVWRSMGRQETS